MKKLGQVSMEYMMVVGFSLLMITPIIAIYGLERQNMNDSVNEKQAYNIAKSIGDAAESVYYLGKPSKTTLKIYMPNNIHNITFGNEEITFRIKKKSGINEVPPVYCPVNISGSITYTPGIKYIEVVAEDYQVNVTEI